MGRIRKIKNAVELIKNYQWLVTKPTNHYFNNSNSLYLEIGCGKGDFLIQSAIRYPNINFIGVEKDSTIVLKVLRKIEKLDAKPTNLLVLNIDAREVLNWFKIGNISKIFLNFSDPWPKKRHEKNRLTSPNFLNIYEKLLKKNGVVEFKTDNQALYEYTKDVLSSSKIFKITYENDDFYSDEKQLENNVQTEYEKKFVLVKKTIKKIIFYKTS